LFTFGYGKTARFVKEGKNADVAGDIAKHLDLKTEFLAGGGTDEEWREYLSLLKRVQELQKQQIEEKAFVSSIFQTRQSQ
jgi:hypothetical protein